MSRTNTLVLIAGLAALMGAATGALGAERWTRTTAGASLNYRGAETDSGAETTFSKLNLWSFRYDIYDYDLYASEPQELAFFVRYYYHEDFGGGYEDAGPFETYADAASFREKSPLGDIHTGAEIVEHLTELDFYFVARFDTYDEAAEAAMALEWLGLTTSIRRYSDLVYVDDDPVLSADW